MRLPFLTKQQNSVSLEKKNQRLARDLLFLFAFKLENKHHSLIELHYNHSIVTIKPEGLPETYKRTDHAAELGVTIHLVGYLTNVFTKNPPNEKIFKKINNILKKHNTFYRIEKLDGDCSVITIHYNNQ